MSVPHCHGSVTQESQDGAMNNPREILELFACKGAIAYEGEGHGFRRIENIQRSLEAELFFYAHVFGFEQADEVAPVEIR